MDAVWIESVVEKQDVRFDSLHYYIPLQFRIDFVTPCENLTSDNGIRQEMLPSDLGIHLENLQRHNSKTVK